MATITNVKTKVKTKEHLYFVKVTKRGDHSFFVGPFKSPELAEQKVQQSIENGNNIVLGEPPVDMPDALSASVEAKIEARRNGLRSKEMGDSVDTTLADIPDSKEWDKLSMPQLSSRGRKRKGDSNGTVVKKTVAKKKSATQSELPKDVEPVNIQPPMSKEPEKQQKTIYVVTPFDGVAEWLKLRHNIEGKRVKWVTKEMAQNGIIIGSVIPDHIKALCEMFGSVAVPFIKPDQKHQNLSPEELDSAGAKLIWYQTREVEGPKLK